MGAWGIEAWANDRAADWYDQLFEQTNLVDRIANTLALDADEHCEEIRAAAKLVVMLNQPEIWPTGVYRKLAAFGSNRLEQLLAERFYSNLHIVADIKADIQTLNAMRSDARAEQNDHENSQLETRTFEP